MIKVKTLTVGMLATNCCIATDEATGYTAVIDPGEFTPSLDKALSEIGYENIKYILLTHGHFDHIGGTKNILEKTGNKAEIAIGEKDVPLLSDSTNNLSLYFCFEKDPITDIPCNIALHDGDAITLGESILKVMHTPGHTAGSICFIGEGVIFSGDTLFFCSHGRTDFPTGSDAQMKESLIRLTSIKGNYTVYPGHNDSTTLEYERKNNPYIGRDIYDNLF